MTHSAPGSEGAGARDGGGADVAHQTTEWILARCRTHAFADAGVARALPAARPAAYRAWLADGAHGAMAYMAEEVETRLDPALLVPGARSVIVVADRYADGRPDARLPGRGRIARYARGEDYHAVIRLRLEALAGELRQAHPSHRFRVCVDSAPLLEREHAERAGLGRTGKHTLLIGREGAGSWLLLGAIVTTLELAPTGPGGVRMERGSVHAGPERAPRANSDDPCGTCIRCIQACPTQAITPWRVDGRRCISALTIEERGEIDPALGARHGDWIFGCDICQEVCPHNAPTRRSTEFGTHPAYAPHWSGFDLLEVLGWTEEDWAKARLHGALRRASRAMWVRNAAFAAGHALANTELECVERAALRGALGTLANAPGEAPEVRAAARAALTSVGAPPNGTSQPSG